MRRPRCCTPRMPSHSPLVPVQGLFESHLTTTNLARAIDFYGGVMGFRVAHVAPARHAVFFWIGSGAEAMLGVWEVGSGPQRMQLHLAFRVALEDVLAAPLRLAQAGIRPLDFDEHPTEEPVVLAWMPAASVFFRDPDGHLLEFVAMLHDVPRPERGVVRWSDWITRGTDAAATAARPVDRPSRILPESDRTRR